MPQLIDAPTTDISRLDTERLLEMIADRLQASANSLAQAAEAFAELKQRDADVSAIPRNTQVLLQRIASQHLSPAVAYAFFPTPSLLNRVMRLPLGDQDRLARGDTIDLAHLTDDGFDFRKVPAFSLDTAEAQQVFASGHIRSVEEQAAWLRSRAEEKASPRLPARQVRIDKRSRSIVVSGDSVSITAQELASYLARLAG